MVVLSTKISSRVIFEYVTSQASLACDIINIKNISLNNNKEIEKNITTKLMMSCLYCTNDNNYCTDSTQYVSGKNCITYV